MSRLIGALAQPGCAEDAQRDRTARLLLGLIPYMLAAIPLIAVLTPVTPRGLVSYALFGGLLLTVWLMARRGRALSAAGLLVAVSFLIVAASLPETGGARSPAMILFVVIVMLAGLLLCWRAAALTAFASIAVGAGMAIAETFGVWVQAPYANTVAYWAVFTVSTLFAAAVLGTALKLNDDTLRHLRANERELAEGNRALKEYTEELETTREALRLADRAIESSISAVAISDLQGTLTYINPAFLRMWGYGDTSEVLGRNAAEFWTSPQDAEQVMEVLRSGGGWIGELTATRKDGSEFDVQVSGNLLVDAQERPTHLLGAFLDVTEVKRAEEERIAREAAEQANLAKSAFLASMSHEIRTPMNAILGFAHLLRKEDSLTSRQAEYVETINRSGTHLLSLINDVLDMSKIEAGRLTLDPTSFSLDALIDDLEVMLRSRGEAKGLTLVVERDESLPDHIVADEGKLRQVLINLLGNALKFTESGTITLRMHAERPAQQPSTQDGLVRLFAEVQDSGPGIAEAELANIFDAFRQAQAGIDVGGTGLGLTISQRLVTMMGGELTVESTVGIGSRFRLEIPVEPTGHRVQEARRTTRRVIGVDRPDGLLRVLVVDDRADNRYLLRALLEPVGFSIEEAANGQEALEAFEATAPDAVLMDMRMPVMDGYEATRRIKESESGRHTPVIAVTAGAFEDEEREILATGADGYVRKPLDPEVLMAALAEHLGLRFLYAEDPA